MRSGDQLERKTQSKTVKPLLAKAEGAPEGTIPDDVLLEIIQNNVQRQPGNDNSSTVRPEPRKLGLVASVLSALAFGGVMLLGGLIMAIFKLVPKSQDSHY